MQKYAVFMVFKSDTALTIWYASYLVFCFPYRLFSGIFGILTIFSYYKYSLLVYFLSMTRMRSINTSVFTSFWAQILYLFMFGTKNTKRGIKSLILDLQQKSNLFWNIWDEIFLMSKNQNNNKNRWYSLNNNIIW